MTLRSLDDKPRRLGVFDGITIALLRQEELTISGELLIAGIASDDGVEMSRTSVYLWT